MARGRKVGKGKGEENGKGQAYQGMREGWWERMIPAPLPPEVLAPPGPERAASLAPTLALPIPAARQKQA